MNTELVIQELLRKVDSLTARLSAIENEKNALFEENRILKARVAEHDSLTIRLTKVENDNKRLVAENLSLKERVSELESQINQNSNNSSKPPSSDGYKKKPAIPRRQGGRPGGQKGHKGHTLHQVEHPDETIYCDPGMCSCGHVFNDDELSLSETRQVFDLPKPRLEVKEYQIYKATCPSCGAFHKGTAPQGVHAPVQYGAGAKAFAVMLNTHIRVPFKKIQWLYKDLFGQGINASTIYSATREFYNALAKSEEQIKTKVTDSLVVHADETGMRVDGRLQWLHTATTERYTYLFVHKNRGKKALESEKSVLEHLSNWLVHDCWGSYFKFNSVRHSVCGAHIVRELESLVENNRSEWADTMQDLLLTLNDQPHYERVRQRSRIIKKYREICSLGIEQEPPPERTPGKRGRLKRTKGRNLVERLIREEEAVLAFAFNKEVPFTNNLAERDIRPAKVKMKVSNCFRTFQGAEIYARIESFMSTARKQERNVFSELCDTFKGYNFLAE